MDTGQNHKNRVIYIGTCGWSYGDDWKGIFYPEKGLKSTEFLKYYCNFFNGVEVDSSFYNLPSKNSIEKWIQETPAEFRFSFKIPNHITHKNKLKIDKSDPILNRYVENLTPMEKSKKCIGHLLQLPPSFNFKKNYADLERFLKIWKENTMHLQFNSEIQQTYWNLIIEFRDRSWINESTFNLLRSYNCAICNVVEPEIPFFILSTRKNKDLIYIRFHGFGNNPWWKYLFNIGELKKYADKIKESFKQYQSSSYAIFFNNHFSGNAVKNALELKYILSDIPLNNIEKDIMKIKKKYGDKEKNETLLRWIK